MDIVVRYLHAEQIFMFRLSDVEPLAKTCMISYAPEEKKWTRMKLLQRAAANASMNVFEWQWRDGLSTSSKDQFMRKVSGERKS